MEHAQHLFRGADCVRPARRYSGALLLLATASVVVACGSGGSSSWGTSSGTVSPSNSATLAWDAVNAPSLLGYRVYYGTLPGMYLQPRGQGLTTVSTTYQVAGLSSQTTYYFAVTAYDALTESAYSSEVSKTMP
jgi:hypothetical protein